MLPKFASCFATPGRAANGKTCKFHVCSVTTIRVPCCVELDTWHVVSAGRHASQGYLQLDDTLVKGKSGGRPKHYLSNARLLQARVC